MDDLGTTRRPSPLVPAILLTAGLAVLAWGMGVILRQESLAGQFIAGGGAALIALAAAWRRRGPNSAALGFLLSAAVWFVVGAIYGLIGAMELVSPEVFDNIGALVFGRVRPLHINTLLYGFITSMLFGCALYILPALLRTPLWSQRLGWASLALWNVVVVTGQATLAHGISQGREYTEYIWIFDLCLIASVVGLIFNLVMTVIGRVEKSLYVSVWYFLGAVLWTAGVYPLGNVVWDPQGALSGVLDSIFLWFYGHNVVGLLFTPLAIGTAYFVVPRITRTPLYSHTLSLLGFWLLVTLYTHIGGHHILQAPIPNWLKTVSVVDSVAMILPVFIVLSNLWLTARGRLDALWADLPGRFVLTGTMWYLLTCIQGPLQSLPAIQKVTHFTNWTVAHAHIAVFGFAGSIAVGGLWHVLPLILKRRMYSRMLLSLQFSLTQIGLGGMFIVLTIAGLIQGQGWSRGEAVYNLLPELGPYMVLRVMFGLFIVAGASLGLWNLVATIFRGQKLEPVPIEITRLGAAAEVQR